MAKTSAKRNKNIAVPILVLSIIMIASLIAVLFATGTFAAYTNSRYAQRTLAVVEGQGKRFSSNCLEKGYSKENVQTSYVHSSSEPPSKIITVCNYERGNPSKPYDGIITYSITAKFVKYDAGDSRRYIPVDAAYISDQGLTAYSATLTYSGAGGGSITLQGSTVSDSLTGKTLESESPIRGVSDVYTLNFSTNFVLAQPNLYVEITVHPENADLNDICGVFKTGLKAPGVVNDWTGAFNYNPAKSPSDYDGYTYRVSGVGSGTVTITWDDTVVTLSDESFNKISGATKLGSSITFNVNSEILDLYDLNFYKVHVTDETWTDMNTEVVVFDFDEA